MGETKSILQQCGIVSNTENNSELIWRFKQTLKTHNGTKKGEEKKKKNGRADLEGGVQFSFLKTFTRVSKNWEIKTWKKWGQMRKVASEEQDNNLYMVNATNTQQALHLSYSGISSTKIAIVCFMTGPETNFCAVHRPHQLHPNILTAIFTAGN